jgi:hypothetical protein
MVGLRWGDVNLFERILYVRRSIGNYDDPEAIEEDDDNSLTTKSEAGEEACPDPRRRPGSAKKLYATVARRPLGRSAGEEQRPTPTVTATGSWPAATVAWTVVLASVGSRSEAEAQQERAHQAALPEAGVLLSTQHSSLRPGYWVAFTGVLSHDEVVRRQQQARTSGFADAYARFVSAE